MILFVLVECLSKEMKNVRKTNSSEIYVFKGYLEESGGAKRVRTADLLNAIQALSQLSYGPR